MCLYNKKGMNTWNDIYDFSEKVLSYILRKKEEEYIQPDQDTAFEDYELRFSHACQPDRIGFTGDCYLNGQTEFFPLEDSTTIRLRHELFDEDAIVLKNMARCVSLCSEKTGKSVTVAYPQMPYLGIWHMPHTDAPYVCIEPWASLPSRQDVVEELSCKSDLIHLAPGAKYENQWSITITEEKECMM